MVEARSPVLIVDDEPSFGQMVEDLLTAADYPCLRLEDSRLVHEVVQREAPVVVLLDITMPHLRGLEVCRRLKADPATASVPVILLTARAETRQIVLGFESGAEDYVTKPFQPRELLARISTQTRLARYRVELERLNAQLEEANIHLDRQVALKAAELDREHRLRRFFSPAVVRTILDSHPDAILPEHKRSISVLFLDLRGFTAFSEAQSAETVMETLRRFHAVCGPLIHAHHGTLERFTGDGFMVFLGDPEPNPDPPGGAEAQARALREATAGLRASWLEAGWGLGVGMGLASGEAVLGTIGFSERMDYAAIGPVTNLACRMCELAADGQILVSRTLARLVPELAAREDWEHCRLKGMRDLHPYLEL